MPKSKITLSTYGDTDVGILRPENEDYFLLNDDLRVYAVADGLGGLPHGDVASQLAIESFEELLEKKHSKLSLPDLKKLFIQVNEIVHNEGMRINEELGMGSTLTATLIDDDNLIIGHVGDTGVLLLKRDGSFHKLTQDHTMAQEILDTLPEGEHRELPDYYYHSLTRCIGQYGKLDADVDRITLEPGDRILLYSDGVTKTFEDDELINAINTEPNPEELVEHIIDTARERGGPDNCTAIAIFVSEAN